MQRAASILGPGGAEILGDMMDLLEKTFSNSYVKTAGAVIVGLVQVLFGREWLPVHTAIVSFLMADWVLGLLYAAITRTASSDRSLRGVIKIGLYMAILWVGHQVSQADTMHVGEFMEGSLLWVMAVTEATSNLENIEKIAAHYRVEIWFLRPMISFLKRRRERVFEDGSNEADVGSR